MAIEPLNLYETHLVRTLADAEELRAAVDHPAAGLLADVFHMNIEERSMAAALCRRTPTHLVHVHLADSNRAEPGAGHIDFDGGARRAARGGLRAARWPWSSCRGATRPARAGSRACARPASRYGAGAPVSARLRSHSRRRASGS